MESPATVIGFASEGIATCIRFDGFELEEASDSVVLTGGFEVLDAIIDCINCKRRWLCIHCNRNKRFN